MKDIIKDIVKILLITIILSLGILLFPKEKKVDAKIESTGGSEVYASEPSNVEKYATGTPIASLVSSYGTGGDTGQQVDGNNVFLSCGEFIGGNKPNFYSLFCCGHGVRLSSVRGNKDYSTGNNVGFVNVNGSPVYVTDSGREIALLKDGLFNGQTIYYHNDEAVVTITDTDHKDYSAAQAHGAEMAIDKAVSDGIFEMDGVKSITYGYYQNGGEENATPAEAYVLTEMRNNTVRGNYVQVAWWAVKAGTGTSGGDTTGDRNGVIGGEAGNPDDDPYAADDTQADGGNDLYNEAVKFEEYILAVANSKGGGYTAQSMKNHYNGNGMFNIDYKDCVSEIDESNVDVLFDYKTNTYRIGPFSIDYIRAGTKAGSREAVDFAGIAKATLTVMDENGTPTELELKHEYYDNKDEKGFRIVYDHERTMQSYDVNDYKDYVKGNNFWYPYPYPNEVFYIEIDYKDALASVKELNFDFHWTNGGGKYENLMSGEAYIVEWEIHSEFKSLISHVDDWCDHGYYCSNCETWHSYWVICHEHQHKSYTMDYWVWLQYKTHTSVVSQPFENGLEAKIGVYEPDIEGDDDRVKGSQGVKAHTGGWDLTTQISGFVWVEGIEYEKGKDIDFGNSKWDEGSKDKRKKNVEVRIHRVVYNKSGNKYTEVKREIAKGYKTKETMSDGTVKLTDLYKWEENRDTRLYTNDNGEYKIYLKVPSVENKKENQVVSYDVEFIYDGQTYEAVEYLVSAGGSTAKAKLQEFQSVSEKAKTSGGTLDYSKYKDDSYIVENDTEDATNKPVASGREEIPLGRLNFDNNFYEVYGDEGSAFGEDKSSKGKAKGTDDTIDLEYEGKMYSEYASETGEDSGGAGGDSDRIVALIKTEEDEYVKEDFQLASRTSTGSFLLPYTERIYIRHYSGRSANEKLKKYAQLEEEKGKILDKEESWYFPIYEYFNQVNLGLEEREKLDLSVAKDLYKAETIVNQQEITYKYSTLRDYENEDQGDYLHQLIAIQKENQSYDFAMYSSDFYYRSEIYNHPSTELSDIITDWKKDTELQMYATYKMVIYNDSETLDATINSITDYFDANFTLVEEDVYKDVIDSEGNRYTKLVAEQPYYRVYSLLNSTLTSSQYKFNSKDDLAAAGGLSRGALASGRSVTSGKIAPGSWQVDGGVYGSACKFKKSTLDMFKYKESKKNFVDSSDGFVLAPGERIELFVTYEIDAEGYRLATGQSFGDAKNARKDTLLGGKNNVIEIGNYSSFYTKESLKHKTVAYKEHQVAGRIDQDSAPNSINLNKTKTDEKGSVTLDKTWFDDDIDSAPVFRIYLREDSAQRKIDGIVWDDEDSSDVRGDSATGNGLYDSGEKGVEGVTVSLVEKIRAPSPGNGEIVEYEFVWPDEISSVMDRYNPVTETGSDGKYSFENFPAGIYQVRFEYGNTDKTLKYNGQDYENTAYQINQFNAGSYEDSEIKNCDTESRAGAPTLDNEWHDLGDNDTAQELANVRVSDARDYEPQRLRVMAYSRTISNSIGEVFKANDKANAGEGTLPENYKNELFAGTSMTANTAKLNFEVEKTSEIDYSDYNATGDKSGLKFAKGIAAKLIKNASEDTQTEEHEYYANNIDFGLEERAKASIQLDKYLKKVQLIKNNGKEVILEISIDDNERINKNAEGTVNDGKVLSLSSSDGVQGYKYITMDSNYFQDLTVNLTYRMDVINEGEVDFTSENVSNIYTAEELRDLADSMEGDYVNNHTSLITGEGIIYGDNVGHYYYANEVGDSDKIVTTTVNQLVDYVDSNIATSSSSTGNSEDLAWVVDNNYEGYRGGLLTTLDGLISEESYTEGGTSDGSTGAYLTDNEGNIYITETRDNLALSLANNIEKEDRLATMYVRGAKGRRVPTGAGYTYQTSDITRNNAYGYKDSTNKDNNYNRKLTKELTPISYAGEEDGEKGEINFITSTTIATPDDANNMNYNNLAEVLVYSNTVGRRTFMQNVSDTEEHETIGKDDIGPSTPGNALEIVKNEGVWEAGHTSNLHKSSNYSEIDADAPEFVTFTEPTGLKYADMLTRQYLQIILIAMAVLALGIIVITIKVVKQKRRK